MSRVLLVLLVLSASARADDGDSYSAVSADEVAKARADKLSCAALETAPDYQMSKRERDVMVARCRADKWRLEAIICFARQSAFGCERWLTPAQEKKRQRAIAKESDAIFAERRAWAVEAARKSGVLGDPHLVAPPGDGVQLNDTRPSFEKRSDGHARPDVWARLRDVDGPVAGLPGYAIKRQEDPKRCGGIAIVVTKAEKAAVGEADAPLAALYDLEAPTGLDNSRHKKAASLRKVAELEQALRAATDEAMRYYVGQLAATKYGAARARIAQVRLRAASLLGRVEIPADLRMGASEDVKAYCDKAQDRAEESVLMAEEAIKLCAQVSERGWWTPVCTVR